MAIFSFILQCFFDLLTIVGYNDAMTNEEIWQSVLSQIQLNISPANFSMSFLGARQGFYQSFPIHQKASEQLMPLIYFHGYPGNVHICVGSYGG